MNDSRLGTASKWVQVKTGWVDPQTVFVKVNYDKDDYKTIFLTIIDFLKHSGLEGLMHSNTFQLIFNPFDLFSF